jgi:hypothetical protein
MGIFPDRSTTLFTSAVLTVAHPDWCTVAECRPTPDWGHDGVGFVAHVGRFLDADGVTVDVVQGESVTAQGEVFDQDPPAVIVEGTGFDRELTPAQASRLAEAISRAASVAGGAR